MTDVKGTAAKVDVSTDGITYTDLGGVKDVSMSIGRETIDVSDFDEPDWQENLVGRGNVTLSITTNYDEDDAGQDIVRTAAEGGTQLYFRYRPRGDTIGYQEYILQGTMDSLDDTSSEGSPAEMSISVASTGALTVQAQS